MHRDLLSRIRRAPLQLVLAAGGLVLLGAGDRPVPAAGPSGSKPAVAYLDGAEVWVKELSPAAPDRRRLATVPGASKVRWSASGRKLAVEGETGLTLVTPEARAAIAVPCDGSWAWAPRGERLAFLREGALWLREEDGRTRRLLPPGRQPVNGAGGIGWSPDGRRLAFVRENAPRRGDFALCAIGTDGTGLRELYHSRGEERAPVVGRWSPDGRQVLLWALYSGRAVSVNADGVPFLAVSAAGGKAKPVAGSEVVVRREEYFDYSPDGRYLLLAQGGGRFDVQNKRLARVDTRSGGWKWLTPAGLAATAPRFSPDGRRIAFVGVPDPGGDGSIGERATRRRLWVMNADGSGRKALTSDGRYADLAPRWLPDGRLLFLREPKDTGHDHEGLWTIDLRGGKPALVAELLGEAAGDATARFDLSSR